MCHSHCKFNPSFPQKNMWFWIQCIYFLNCPETSDRLSAFLYSCNNISRDRFISRLYLAVKEMISWLIQFRFCYRYLDNALGTWFYNPIAIHLHKWDILSKPKECGFQKNIPCPWIICPDWQFKLVVPIHLYIHSWIWFTISGGLELVIVIGTWYSDNLQRLMRNWLTFESVRNKKGHWLCTAA